MAVTLFDKDGNIIDLHDLQDKLHWCADGENQEQAFIRRYGSDLGYAMNPQKDNDPYAPDLLSTATGVLADLKSQHSPFFKAKELYNIDPTYAVVFNLKDKIRYAQNYPNIDILYYLDWIAVKADIHGRPFSVAPLCGVFRVPFWKFFNVLDGAPLHTYGQRRYDHKGNARSSYVVDIRNPAFEQLM